MAVNNMFSDLARDLSSKQPELVDHVLQEAPILNIIPFEPTTNGLQHVYEEQVSATGNGLVDLDSELPVIDSQTKLESTYLSVLGGEMSVGEDKAKQFGGPGAYFMKKIPSILKKTGSDTETSIIYNNFRAKAIEAYNTDTLIDKADHAQDALGVGATNYSMLAVKFESGQVTGLYDPAGFGRGMLFDMEALNNGALMKVKGAGTTQINGYAMRLKSYFGILVANLQNVATIVNIDLVNSKTPTETQIDTMIKAVRGTGDGRTWLFMHPKVKTFLNTFKASHLQTTVQTRDYVRTFDAWNGIPIVESYNFKPGNEPQVVL